MTISSALNTALSGLSVSSRMAEVTASNISNALTEGYARREVQLSARVLGHSGVGVTVTGITRQLDKAILQDLRLSTASQGFRTPVAEFQTRMESLIGAPDQPGSLNGRIGALERALIEAAGRPDSAPRLTMVVETAQRLTEGLVSLSQSIQTERKTADTQIAADVKRVNDSLEAVADLNQRILAFGLAGRDTSALADKRQQAIDSISHIVPLREVARDHDQVALYTTGGTVLLDGRPARLGFTAAGVITPDMTAATALSGLTVNGQSVTTSPDGGRLGEGRLAALFSLRDTVATDTQSRLDALARDLIDRVSAAGVDPTRPIGDPALFTDDGAALDPLNEVGLAGRLSLNPLVVPEQGGALWRLKDGLGALAMGPGGNADRLTALTEALANRRPAASGGLPPGARSLAEFASDITSVTAVDRLAAEASSSFAAARSDALRSEMLRDGVDTDQEMQDLLLVEKAYAANAKVIQTVDQMLSLLLEM